jgi:peptidoglycan/LPS O-acetylase OafA/YrhL
MSPREIVELGEAGCSSMTHPYPARPTPGERAADRRPDGFRPDIQGLRAIAVGSVVVYHAGMTVVSGGYVGVDIFFVISGFLITTHLLRDVLRTGRISFSSFYARRARRILPASLVVNGLTLVAAILLIPATELKSTAQDAIATALYVPNMVFAHRATDYLAQSSAPSLYQHFWSLGVEEQFYLLWPLLLVAMFALVRKRRWLLGVVLGAVALTSFAACVRLTTTNQPWAFFALPTRAWEFAIGGLVALILFGGWRPARIPAMIAVLLGLAGLGVAIFGFTDGTRFPGSAAALPVLATALAIIGGADNRSGRWLGTRPMAFVGEISYSLYLVHWPILTLARYANGNGRALPMAYRLGLLLLCLAVAYLLYRFVETPMRRTRRYAVGRLSRTLVAALAASTAVVLAAIATGAASASAPISTNRIAADPALVRNPTGTGYVPANLEPTLSTVSSDNPATYADGCHLAIKTIAIPSDCTFGPNPSAPLVVLFGDSHAAEWFPALEALAETGKIRLESDTKSGCPSAEIDVYYKSGTGPLPYPECPVWRAAVLARLAAAPPALVVISNLNQPDLPGGGYPTPAQWSAAMTRTLAELPSSSKALVLGETPLPGTAPADCLVAHLSDTTSCDLVRSTVLDPAMTAAEKTAARGAKARYEDLSSYLCNTSICPPIIGDVLVYRDAQHLTATFAKVMTPVLSRQVQDALAVA